jgi:hypothetical protein
MPAEEDRVRELLRQAYHAAENSPWDLSPEAIRARRRRFAVALPEPKLLAAVAAVAILIVTGFFVIGNPTSHNASVGSMPSTTTTVLSSTPTLVVTPSTNLRNGQTIRVSVSNWPPGKAHLSECASAADVGAQGCGAQVAAQPFAVIEYGSGAAAFTVTSQAALGPLSSATQNCTTGCVLVATGGVNPSTGRSGLAYAPISFAP